MNIKIHGRFFTLLLFVLIIFVLFSGLFFKAIIKPFIKPADMITPTATPPSDIYIPQDADIEQLITQTKEDLSRRLNIASSDIKVIQTQKKSWPDTSLGCPKPGKLYAQVITPGFLIVLSAKGDNYNYHTSLKNVVLCQ